ncbi:glutathione transferase [Anaeromyxobacter paludicola]|uniref:Glutathione S-transferase n=1 Tax=Anaeromyxobacter paludicola TaxID=2918171 RepID=A0ABM7XFA2_9BACT|nr:glutathione transferase [Anaeromyxobacter paludicola]BDG10579.1 glutathione S-transferase [Anaeromyxobacter paludicola]
MSELVLYGDANWHSPYAFSCYVALREKGLPFEYRTLSLEAGEHRAPDYQRESLTGRVPALRHGEFWLSESSAIDEYLEDVFPPPGHAGLYPAEPRQRARARQLQAFLRSDLLPLRVERPTSTVFGREAVEPLTPAGEEAARRLVAAAERLLSPGAAALFGDFGIADADLALMLQRLAANGDPLPERLLGYAAGIWQRPSVKGFIARELPPGR